MSLILWGQRAIDYKNRHPEAELNKYNDPIEDALSDISIEKAEDVCRDDQHLIWIEIPENLEQLEVEEVNAVEADAMADLEEMYFDSFFAQVDSGELIPIPIEDEELKS